MGLREFEHSKKPHAGPRPRVTPTATAIPTSNATSSANPTATVTSTVTVTATVKPEPWKGSGNGWANVGPKVQADLEQLKVSAKSWQEAEKRIESLEGSQRVLQQTQQTVITKVAEMEAKVEVIDAKVDSIDALIKSQLSLKWRVMADLFDSETQLQRDHDMRQGPAKKARKTYE